MNEKTLSKPSKDFPLTPTKGGYWVKKIKGVQYRIGSRWAGAEDALKEWLRVKDELLAGDPIQPDPNALQLRDAMNFFLSDRLARLEAGEIVQRSYEDSKRECKNVVNTLGAAPVVADLTPAHFAKLKASFNYKSPHTLAGCIARVRVAFKYLYDAGLIDKPMRFGPSFKRPSAKTFRIHRASKPKKLLTAAELRLLVANASPKMAAMVLLAINCGYGNADCGGLKIEHLDLANGWVEFPRPKTGIERRAWLWAETIAALLPIVDSRTEGHVFLTKYGKPWTKGTTANPLSAEFRKLTRKLEIKQTFYAIRHTFETRAGDSRDQVAVDHLMGHLAPGMAATYREEIADDRLKAACETVREWYLK